MAARGKGSAEERWRGLIAQQERSGEGVAQFAERRGLCAATLYWWRSRLRRGLDDGLRLAPIEVAAAPQSRERPAHTDFEIELSSGRRLRVREGFDERELARLISALERSC